MTLKKFLKKSMHDKNQLVYNLDRTRMDLEIAYANFQNVVDPDLIDSYIYEVNACQERYKYYLKQAKLMESKTPAV